MKIMGKEKYLFLQQWITVNKALCVVMLGGFLLRIISVFWGVPFSEYVQSYHPDEYKVYSTIINFPSVYWTRDLFPAYGTTVQYIVGILLLPFKFVIVKLLSLREVWRLVAIVAGRLAGVLLGTGSLYLCYRCAARLFDKRTGLIAAAFLSCSFYYTLNSPLCTVDVPMGFFLLLSFLLFIHLYENNTVLSSVAFGVGIALMLGTKITSGMFVVLACVFLLVKAFEGKGFSREIFIRQLKLMGISLSVGAVIFVVFHPHIFLDLSKYVGFYVREKVDWVDRFKSLDINVFYQWFNKTCIAVGIWVTVLAFMGSLFAWRGKRPYSVMLLLFLAAYYAFWRYFIAARSIATIAPFLCILAAYTCVALIKAKYKIVKVLGWSCIVLTLCYSLYACVWGIYLRLNDTRIAAGEYIQETIPFGTKVGVGSVSEKYTWRTHKWRMPKIDFSQYRETDFLEYPDILIMNRNDIDVVTKVLGEGKVNKEYVLDDQYNNEWYRYSGPSPAIFKFYDEVFVKEDGPYELVKTFLVDVRVPLEFPPPEIRIYRKK